MDKKPESVYMLLGITPQLYTFPQGPRLILASRQTDSRPPAYSDILAMLQLHRQTRAQQHFR